MNKYPEIRFAGFNCNWDECSLAKLADFSKGRGYTKKDLIEKGEPIILYGRLYTKYETIISEIDTYTLKKINSVISEGGEVVVPASGESENDISRASVISGRGIILGGDLNIIKPNKKLNPNFLALTISNGTQKKEMMKRAQGKSIVHLQNSDLKQINLFFPKIFEQQKIGDFFKQQDYLISLHKDKICVLENLKKALLNKMFTCKAQSIPKFRFYNFNNVWNKKYFKKLLIKSNKKNRDLEINYIESISNKDGFIKQTEQFSDYTIASKNLSNYYVIVAETFAYNPSRINVGSIAYKSSGDNVSIVSPLYVAFSTTADLNDTFLWYWFKTHHFKGQRQKLSEGGVRDTLSFNKMLEIKIDLPDINEQEKIGVMFKLLDKQIKTYFDKIKNLQELKKYFLKKMFF